MPVYRLHRLKESVRQQFRWSAHTSGDTAAKVKDYELVGTIEAESPYAAWNIRKQGGAALELGDVLEQEDGSLQMYKYIGFEPAHWVRPEPKVTVQAESSPIVPAGSTIGGENG